MARGDFYCPICESVRPTRVVNWDTQRVFANHDLTMGTQVWTDTEPPIHGYRRVRDCESRHDEPITTVEVDEDLIEELIRLRKTVREVEGAVGRIAEEAQSMKHGLSTAGTT